MAMKKQLVQRIKKDNPKTFDDVYEEFILSRKIMNVSEATLKFYFWNIKPFKDYLTEKGIEYFTLLKQEDIDSFILWLIKKYDNTVTINTYLKATKAHIRFALEHNYIIEKVHIKLIKQQKKVKQTYSDTDIKKLLKKPDLKNCPFAEYRNWVIVHYLLETGNRLNTVVNIKVKDFSLDAGMVALKTIKNKKEMYFPLGKAMVRILTHYIKEWGLLDEDYLFPNSQKQQLSKNAIQNAIAKHNSGRGVQLHSIHAFRHTFAKRYVMKGGNAFKLQRLLGHSSLTVTENYISLFANDLAQDFEQFSTINEFSTSKRIKRK
jgi:Site-specific recombinase XerD